MVQSMSRHRAHLPARPCPRIKIQALIATRPYMVMTGAGGGERNDLSALDILLMGQLSAFDDLNLIWLLRSPPRSSFLEPQRRGWGYRAGGSAGRSSRPHPSAKREP
jgi:hypothetical protein